jgi:hypothetical protein
MIIFSRCFWIQCFPGFCIDFICYQTLELYNLNQEKGTFVDFRRFNGLQNGKRYFAESMRRAECLSSGAPHVVDFFLQHHDT